MKEGDVGAFDRDARQYDAFCRLVDREDRLIQQRFSNLLTTQGLLFVALSLAGDQDSLDRLVKGLPLIGMAVSLAACGTVWAGFSSLHRLENYGWPLVHTQIV